ncbi:hypothetical protein GW17_00053839 [Ensete ventricosum]|nr:hypothetical protein GW17_00053839 [Ensete ventricosum]
MRSINRKGLNPYHDTCEVPLSAMSSIVLRAMQSPLSPVSDWRCYFHGGFDFTVVEQPGVVSAELRPEEARRCEAPEAYV